MYRTLSSTQPTYGQRSDGDALLPRQTHLQVVDCGAELGQELVDDRLVHEYDLERSAALPVVAETAQQALLHGYIQVGTGQHDGGVLGVQTETHPQAVGGWVDLNQLISRRVGADEGEHVQLAAAETMIS